MDWDKALEDFKKSPLNVKPIRHGDVIPDWASDYFNAKRERHHRNDKVTIIEVIEGFELTIQYTVNRTPYWMYVRKNQVEKWETTKNSSIDSSRKEMPS